MNVFGERARGWKRGRKRGVSPIIATILLVAITVVLAAVLYVLVSGLTRSGASTPYQLGMAVSSTSTAGTGATESFYVSLSLSPTSGLTTSAFGMTVTVVSTGGTATLGTVPAACGNGDAWTVCTEATGDWYAVLTESGNVVATLGVGEVWSNYATGVTTVALSGAFNLVIVSNSLYDDGGHTLSAYGVGSSSVSGSVTL